MVSEESRTTESGPAGQESVVAASKPAGRTRGLSISVTASAIAARFASMLRAIGRFVVWIAETGLALLRWLLVPKGDSLFDFFKHYVALLFGIIGFTALLWAGKQILYPPLVITVAELPEPVRKENWLNTELSRALMDQIERMRTIVKIERDPSFEAVLNPPNIVVKSGEFSFNVQEQLLTPLGALLGRSQGEVHVALTCYHPSCARTRDSECQQVIAAPRTPVPANADISDAHVDDFLCLRATVDIRRGASFKRLTVPLNLSNGTYLAETTKQMARIAQAVTTVADPATAALYFYQLAKQDESLNRILVDDGQAAELRGQAFEAAAAAEELDGVSACWAHAVRAPRNRPARVCGGRNIHLACERN
jgi:hypothetical protein